MPGLRNEFGIGPTPCRSVPYQKGSPVSSSYFTNPTQMPSQTMDTIRLKCTQASEYEDAESDNCQASSRYHSFFESQECEGGAVMNKLDTGLLNSYHPVDCQSGLRLHNIYREEQTMKSRINGEQGCRNKQGISRLMLTA
ncbi:PREDICTED: uncharacterized protein LOC104595701 [Nelumbo nucifera]|uniref:Uncharacterized protein LOC104595701 n=1 Tax=Nelumbo nucifera TaxID=4432 RepID=A0A1U8Q312_NELNU|nr:PREDICTED: uncharacterized protein LOC104595701 [Nelumbo nucifera]